MIFFHQNRYICKNKICPIACHNHKNTKYSYQNYSTSKTIPNYSSKLISVKLRNYNNTNVIKNYL